MTDAPPQFDEEVLAAWRLLCARGLVRFDWEGLVPVGVMNPELVNIHFAAHGKPPERTVPPAGRRRSSADRWTHGTRLGRDHRSVRQHLVEDHGVAQAQVDAWSDGSVHGHHDGVHQLTWAYAKDLAHPAPGDGRYLAEQEDQAKTA